MWIGERKLTNLRIKVQKVLYKVKRVFNPKIRTVMEAVAGKWRELFGKDDLVWIGLDPIHTFAIEK